MKDTYTDIKFDKHELIITDTEDLKIWHLKIPGTIENNIKYINTNGIMAVTGDFGNWIFCREFHPSPKDGASEGYWIEKLCIASTQEPRKYDSEKTEARIKEMMKEEDLDEEEKEYLEECLRNVDDELDYAHHAYRNTPSNRDFEYPAFVKSTNIWLLYILDGFDEICRRLKEAEQATTVTI